MKKLFSAIMTAVMLFAFTPVVFADSLVAVSNPVNVIRQTIAFADWTDGGGAAGTISLTDTLPIGGIPIAWRATTTTAFDASTSAILLVGISGDTDKFSASDGQDIDTAGVYGDSALGEAVGCDAINAAQTILLTLTEDSEWGDMSAGVVEIEFFYLKP